MAILKQKDEYEHVGYQLQPGKLVMIAAWCNGSVKGVALPESERAIDFWSGGEEYRAEIGDWIVNIRPKAFFKLTDREFHERYEAWPIAITPSDIVRAMAHRLPKSVTNHKHYELSITTRAGLQVDLNTSKIEIIEKI